MSISTYGIVGAKNTTVTMITTVDEDTRMSVNTSGDKLPPETTVKRKMRFDKRRLGGEISIFPV